MPSRWSTVSARVTTSVMFSSSLRHGITTGQRQFFAIAVARNRGRDVLEGAHAVCMRRETTGYGDCATEQRTGGGAESRAHAAASRVATASDSLSRLMRVCIVYDCLFPWTWGRGALVSQPGGAARGGGPRRHVPHAAAVGARRSAPDRRACAWSPSRAATSSTAPTATAASRPPLRFGRGVLAPPAAPRRRLRRRPHGLVPVLLAAGRGAGAAAAPLSGWWSTGSRCGRASTGRLPRRAGRPHRLRGPARVRADPAAGVLLQPAAPRPAAGARAARRRGAAGGRVRRRPDAARARDARAGGGVRRAPHPARSAPPAVPPAVAAARASCRTCAASCSATGRSGEAVRAAIERAGAASFVSAPGFVEPRRAPRRHSLARCACCCPPAARATGWWWSRPPRRGRRRSWCGAPTTPPSELVEDGVNGVRRGRAPSRRSWPGAILRVHEGGRALRERTCRLVRRAHRGRRAASAATARCDDASCRELVYGRSDRARS